MGRAATVASPLFIARCVWYILPAYIGNMAPLVVAMFMRGTFAFPLDCNQTLNGTRIFGPNKTWRGVFAGVTSAIGVASLQSIVYAFPAARTLRIGPNDQVDPLWWGLLMGLGALSGDAVKSFVKRRRGIAPGQSWKPFDQIDFLIGALAFSSIAFRPPWTVYAGILVVMPVVKVLVGSAGYALGLRPTKW